MLCPRAVHLELTRSMTTESFLLGLTWMMSRRGKIDVLWSDNFKSFKNADKELRQSWEVISSDITQERVQGSGICWKFISPRAPHWKGGFYERLVKSVKTPFKTTLGKAMLTGEEMRTHLQESRHKLIVAP